MNFDYNTVFLAAPVLKPKTGMKSYNHEINGVEFSRDIQNTILKMAQNEYELIQTIPLISSMYYGKTYTEGVTLIFRREFKPE
jgi:hypothetical protein